MNKQFKLLAVMTAAGLLLPELALAAQDLSAVAGTVTNQAQGIAGAAKMIGFLAGFIFVLVGVTGIIKAKKRDEGMGLPIISLVTGVLLLSAITFAQVGSQSVFGEDGGVNDLLN